MRSHEVSDALREACEESLHTPSAFRLGDPVRIRGKSAREKFLHRLRAFLRELPEGMTVAELREEIDEVTEEEKTP